MNCETENREIAQLKDKLEKQQQYISQLEHIIVSLTTSHMNRINPTNINPTNETRVDPSRQMTEIINNHFS